ncbi:hypothetical protein [Streptomyces bacillaris]|uniref:hypothetical protein n=1 Tax=Streptomyces bacillaris TaxID=68179 RepID=UPI0036FDDD8A
MPQRPPQRGVLPSGERSLELDGRNGQLLCVHHALKRRQLVHVNALTTVGTHGLNGITTGASVTAPTATPQPGHQPHTPRPPSPPTAR